MSGPIAIGILVACGVYLLQQRSLVRVALGFVLLGHAVNILLVISGGTERRGVPIVGESNIPGDPLPQAFVLTAIVIGFGMTAFILALAALRARATDDDDLEATEEDERQ